MVILAKEDGGKRPSCNTDILFDFNELQQGKDHSRGDDSSFSTLSLWGLLEADSDTEEQSIHSSARYFEKTLTLTPESAPSLHTSHLELLQADHQRLRERHSGLEQNLESIQKTSAKHMMDRCQLEVQIDLLKEDKLFLLEKLESLSRKLWGLHNERRTKGNIQCHGKRNLSKHSRSCSAFGRLEKVFDR